MEKGTFWIESEPNGDITIGIEDYDVEFFDGGDYEMMWTLDPESIRKLTDILARTQTGTLEDMMKKEFGIHLEKKSLSKWLDENDIEYKYSCWTSYD